MPRTPYSSWAQNNFKIQNGMENCVEYCFNDQMSSLGERRTVHEWRKVLRGTLMVHPFKQGEKGKMKFLTLKRAQLIIVFHIL